MDGTLALVAQYVQNVLHQHNMIFKHNFSSFFREKNAKETKAQTYVIP
jgi:hypothetical protein